MEPNLNYMNIILYIKFFGWMSKAFLHVKGPVKTPAVPNKETDRYTNECSIWNQDFILILLKL